MRVYTGILVGGPDQGNSVSASVPRIKTKTTTEMWLDGENKSSSLVVEEGSYYWHEATGSFKWNAESVDFYSKRVMLQAA
jgi:hypothetical protein